MGPGRAGLSGMSGTDFGAASKGLLDNIHHHEKRDVMKHSQDRQRQGEGRAER
jgi:hypothetical protein